MHLPAGKDGRAWRKTIDKRNLIGGIGVREGEQGRFSIRTDAFEFQEVGDIGGSGHTPVPVNEVADIRCIHGQAQGMFVLVITFPGKEVNVFRNVQVQMLIIGKNDGVRLRIMPSVRIQVMILIDGIVQLGPDLGRRPRV